MPMDAICLSAVVKELQPALVGGRVDKIYQPARDEVIVQVRGPEGSGKLLLSASPTRPRIQMTRLSRENPAEPPMFCMLLRKYLAGGRIVGVTQPNMERMVELQIEATDEMGDRGSRRLILEAMGRRANLILLDGEGRIVDCLRRVDAEMNQERQILPGMFYHLPPSQGKQDPTQLTPPLYRHLLKSAPIDRPADQWLLETFGGISPLIAREIAFEALGETDGPLGDHGELLLERLQLLLETVESGGVTPTLLVREGKPTDFSFRPILQYGPAWENRTYESFSRLLDDFYAERETSERVRQKGQDLIRSVTTARDRAARKLGLQAKELKTTQDRERLRIAGDLITANLYRMQKGMSTLKTVDFYDPEEREASISLDPLLTPQQNAAKYYKRYQKAKTAEAMLTQQIAKGEREKAYLDSVLESLSRAQGERDLMEIRQELEEQGILRRRAKAKDRVKRPALKPLEFRSSAGLRISVGRNNSQNDQLTTKLAGPRDLWLHTQKIHGAHVILWTEGQPPDIQSVTEAAMLAAWFSQAGKGAAKVPVDYTPAKFVKNPAGARPGMVIYTTYETAYVTPDADVVSRLQAT